MVIHKSILHEAIHKNGNVLHVAIIYRCDRRWRIMKHQKVQHDEKRAGLPLIIQRELHVARLSAKDIHRHFHLLT